MTIVLQHQFRALEVGEDAFSVNLSFQSRSERLKIPFAAVTTFADPSVNFGLQFQVLGTQPAEVTALPAQIPPPDPTGAAGGRGRDYSTSFASASGRNQPVGARPTPARWHNSSAKSHKYHWSCSVSTKSSPRKPAFS